MIAATGPRLTIDLDAIARNYAVLAAASGSAETAAVVKADGYGLGAGPIARRLWSEGARTFFVARLSEGVALRRELDGRQAEVLVLDGLLTAPQIYVDAALTPVLNTFAQARQWQADGRSGGVLQLDTGMNRLGVSIEEARELALSGFRPSLIMSHLACASEPAHPMNTRQLASFQQARNIFPGAKASLANSAGVFLGAEHHFDLVRPGIALYGGAVFSNLKQPSLAPVVTLTAPILQVQQVEPGESVGYGADWIATRTSRVAIVAAGYADGLLRAAAPGGLALGGALPLVGRISMDMLAIDITEAAELDAGDDIELLGPATSINTVAAAAGTISYEVLTRISTRAERAYRGAA